MKHWSRGQRLSRRSREKFRLTNERGLRTGCRSVEPVVVSPGLSGDITRVVLTSIEILGGCPTGPPP